jgi:hypothetical protein
MLRFRGTWHGEAKRMTTLLFDDRTTELTGEIKRGDELWIATRQCADATGWRPTPEGMCQGPVCMPIPPEGGWIEGEHFNVCAFARSRRQGVARDHERDIWSFGPVPESRLASGEAPDFSLPDFGGRLHRLSDYRGKKVLLMTWASW